MRRAVTKVHLTNGYIGPLICWLILVDNPFIHNINIKRPMDALEP